MKDFEKLFWIVEATHELRKNRGGYVAASTLFSGAKDSLKILAPYRPTLLGGFAIGVYAEPRATQDLDLTILPEDLNPALDALMQEGFHQKGVTDFKGVILYHLERSGFKLDLLQFQSKTFQQGLITRAQPNSLFDENISVISPEDLIATKLLSFRSKDKIDIISLLETKELPLDLGQIKTSTQDLKIFDRYSFVEEHLPEFRKG
jgi:hypothetical protein